MEMAVNFYDCKNLISTAEEFVTSYQGGSNIKVITVIFTVVPCILILSKSFIYQLMHNRVALKEY